MADGYIGKISAVVTANTSDLEAKLRKGKDAVDAFANGLNASLSASSRNAESSLQKIFTPLQQLERKMQMALKLNLRSESEIYKLRALVSAAEQINKPVAAAAKQFAQLPIEMQGAFLPALKEMQSQVVKLNLEIQNTGSTGGKNFETVRQAAENAAAAVGRLSQAQRLLSSGPSGTELQFTSPNAYGAMQSSAKLRQQASELPEASLMDGNIARQVRLVAGLDRDIARAVANLERVRLKPKVDASEVASAEKKVSRLVDVSLRAQSILRKSVQPITPPPVPPSLDARRTELANSFRDSFGGAGTRGVLFGLQQNALSGYTAQLQLLQNAIGRVAGSARGPAVQAFNVLRNAIAEALEAGTLGSAATQRRINLLMQGAVREAAQAGGVSRRGLSRQLSRAGDVARGAGGNAGLAIQQAVFAVDDFMSVTGGLDQRIRAAGNNISQLGFIIGGTAGLFGGVLVSALAQAGAGLYRWMTRAEEAESATKRMNKALEAQRNQTIELADAYKRLADSIASSGLSDKDRERRDRRRDIEDVVAQQRERVRAVAEANMPNIGAKQARVDAVDKQLENEVNITERRRLIAERNRLTRGIDANIARTVEQGTNIANTALRYQGSNAVQSLQTGYMGLRVTQQQLVRAQERGDTRAVAALTQQLAALTVAIQILNDRQVITAFERQQGMAGTLSRAQNEMQNVQGVRLSDWVGRISTEMFQASLDRLLSGEISLEEFNRITAKRLEEAQAIEKASYQVAAFSDAMNKAAGDVARAVETELSQRAESLRREANAAEARFGAGDPRTAILRQQQADVEAARRAATENRQAIDSQISQQRLRFENQALQGVGNPQAAAIAARIQELQAIVDRQIPNGPGAGDALRQQEAARLEIEVLRQQLRDLFDSLPGTQELRRRADQGDVAAQRQLQQMESVARGMELSMTPAERAGQELAQKIDDIRNYADKAAEVSSGLPADVARIRERAQNAITRITDEEFRRVAPAIANLGDSVANAVLQGPSRAALNVSDVSTVDGAKELNRLLRGEDPAKDQNLLELRKQSQQLSELVQIARERGVIPVANN